MSADDHPVKEYILSFAGLQDSIQAESRLRAKRIPVSVSPAPEGMASGPSICLRVRGGHLGPAWDILAEYRIPVQGLYAPHGGGYAELSLPVERVFSKALGLRPGSLTAVIGAGGRSTLLHRLCMENRLHPVLLAASGRMPMPPFMAFDRMLDACGPLPEGAEPGITLLYGEEASGMLSAPAPDALAALRPADGYTVLDCGTRGAQPEDGSEPGPPVPRNATLTAGVCAVWPVGRALSEECAWRFPKYCALTACRPGDTITLEHVAEVISSDEGLFSGIAGRKHLLINQIETEGDYSTARALAELLPDSFRGTLSGIGVCSIRQGRYKRVI